jgi:hypothetical protein
MALVAAHTFAVTRNRNRTSEWYSSLRHERPGPGVPKVYRGEIVAIESVSGDPQSQRQAEFVERFDNALAVDMESMGVARALHEARDYVHYNPVWLCVRSISDSVRSEREYTRVLQENSLTGPPLETAENSEVRRIWKPYSSAIAARFTLLLLERLLKEPRPPSIGDPGASSYRFSFSWTRD